MCQCICWHTFGGLERMSSMLLYHHSVAYISEQLWVALSLELLFQPGSHSDYPSFPSLPSWSYRWMSGRFEFLDGCWGFELRSSCLCSKLFLLTGPFPETTSGILLDIYIFVCLLFVCLWACACTCMLEVNAEFLLLPSPFLRQCFLLNWSSSFRLRLTSQWPLQDTTVFASQVLGLLVWCDTWLFNVGTSDRRYQVFNVGVRPLCWYGKHLSNWAPASSLLNIYWNNCICGFWL